MIARGLYFGGDGANTSWNCRSPLRSFHCLISISFANSFPRLRSPASKARRFSKMREVLTLVARSLIGSRAFTRNARSSPTTPLRRRALPAKRWMRRECAFPRCSGLRRTRFHSARQPHRTLMCSHRLSAKCCSLATRSL